MRPQLQETLAGVAILGAGRWKAESCTYTKAYEQWVKRHFLLCYVLQNKRGQFNMFTRKTLEFAGLRGLI